jgi:hypothetical protein
MLNKTLEGDMKNSVTKCAELILGMDNDELNQVIETVQLRRQFLTKQATRSLTVGNTVSFTSSRTGRLMQGRINKVARKYITIDCGVDGLWKVPGNMVESV